MFYQSIFSCLLKVFLTRNRFFYFLSKKTVYRFFKFSIRRHERPIYISSDERRNRGPLLVPLFPAKYINIILYNRTKNV